MLTVSQICSWRLVLLLFVDIGSISCCDTCNGCFIPIHHKYIFLSLFFCIYFFIFLVIFTSVNFILLSLTYFFLLLPKNKSHNFTIPIRQQDIYYFKKIDKVILQFIEKSGRFFLYLFIKSIYIPPFSLNL